jgi:hypothetical protein
MDFSKFVNIQEHQGDANHCVEYCECTPGFCFWNNMTVTFKIKRIKKLITLSNTNRRKNSD